MSQLGIAKVKSVNGPEDYAKNIKKKGRPCKLSFCKNCQEEFPNALIKGLHTINDCARNRQKKKRELEDQKSEDVQKFENPGHVGKIQSHVKASRVPVVLDEPRQTRNIKRSKSVKKVPNVRSRKKTRKKKRQTDSDNDEFANEEKTSDLDSPIVKKKCLNRPEKLEMVNKNATTKLTQSTKVKSEKEISVQEVENSGGDSSSVIETLGELVAEANNNIKKSEESEDLDLDSKLRSVDIFPLEVCITEHVTVAVEDNILIENETEVRNGGHIEEIMATKGEESNNQGKSTVNDTVNKDKQNKRKLKKERRKQWEIRRELRIRGDSKATIEKEIGKRISQGSNSNKMNKISSHDLNLKIEKIDEDDRRKAALKARSSKSILRNPQIKITSNDSQAENLGETSKKSFGLTLPKNRFSESSSQIRPPVITKTSTTRPLASRPYNTLQLASTLYQTIPLVASPRQSIPLASSLNQTIPLASSLNQTIPLAASPRQTMPLAEQLKLTDESDTNEMGAAEQSLKSWVNRDNAHHYAGENINTKGMSTIGVTQSYGGGGGSKEDKIVTNNNTFAEKVSDKNSVKYEITEKRLDIEQKSSVLFGSPKKISPTMNTSKDSVDDSVMNCEDSDELNISYDGLKFSDEEEAQDGEFSDDQVEEGCQPLASSDKTKHSSSLASPLITCTSSHLDPSVQIEKKDVNENRKTLANENLGGKSNDEANDFILIKVKEEKAVTMKPDDLEEEDDEIELDVSYTMFDEEEESSGHEKDNKVEPRNDKDASKVKSEKNKEFRKSRNRIEVKEKENRVSALDYVVPQERNNDDDEEKKETARRKTVEERRRNFEQEQLQRRGNYCLSLVKCVPCVTEGCSWVHVLDPQAALDHFYSLYHNTDQEDPSRRLLFFWKFHAMKSVPAGRAVLSAISDLASRGKLKINIRDFSQLVDFLQSFPDFYTMSLEPGRLVMENLLEAFMSALEEEEEHRGRKAEIETFFAFAWNRIYLSSLRHGLVLKQKTLESICSLAENVHWYCQMVELMFLSSLCPTTWISVEKTSSLLSRISASSDNALSCECRGQEHSREACLHLAKTLSRLMVSEWGTLARETQIFDTKLQILINAVGGDSPQNIGRFVERIKQIYQGQVFLLPQLEIKSQRLKERLERQVSAGKWRDVARDLVMIEKVRVEDMVELVEELYGLMTHLAPHVAAAGLDNLLKELEVLHCSQIHRQLYCQLGISLLINMIAMDKFPEGARVVQAIGRTGVDVRTLKPFTVFELANLDENFTPIAVPLMMLDVYICSGYIELAVNLVAHWEYLEAYPRPLQSGDQQRKFDIFERILDKSLARNGENSLPMRLRIYKILCSGDVSQMPLVRRNKMKQNGKNILVEMLNRNTKGGDLWTLVEELDRALYVVTGEVARGVLLRLVQAGMKEEATSLYRRTELSVTGTYEKQDTRAEELKLLLKSYYSFEELQIIIAEFFHELKKTLFIGEKNVSILISEADIPQSGIFLLKRVVTSKKEALNRVRQILAYMKLQMLVSFDDIPFIPKEQVYKYIEESV